MIHTLENIEVAALQGTTFEYDPHCDDMVDVIKKDVGHRAVTYEQFDSMFYIINEFYAARKEDCIFYRVVDGDILLKNHRGEERLISMTRFLSMYTI